MCWIDDLLSFWFPPQRDSASIPDSGGADPLKSVSGKQASAPPDIPEMYLRPELIPIKEPDGAAVEEAARVLRSKAV